MRVVAALGGNALLKHGQQTGGLAVIGSMSDTPALLRGDAGTTVTLESADLELAAREGDD